jgi:hypothetical protein
VSFRIQNLRQRSRKRHCTGIDTPPSLFAFREGSSARELANHGLQGQARACHGWRQRIRLWMNAIGRCLLRFGTLMSGSGTVITNVT